jgi:uncharacterized protein YfaS (alpha-2-macroglobulin family)
MELKLGHLIRRFWLPISIVGILLVAVGAFLILRDRDGDTPGDQVNPPLIDTSTDSVEGGFVSDDGDSVLLISLSEGQAGIDEIEPVPTDPGEPLTEDEIDRIIARLPSFDVEPEDQEDFNLPEDPLPPPRTGETIDEVFPRIEIIEPEPVETGPLEVLRYSPEGEIPLAPFVNITFNQPMVPIATLSELASIDVPASLLPDVPGSWRWVGTKTLSLEHDSSEIDRLPKATEYQVIIPAGITSATGGVLEDTVRWTFSTPPPKMTTYSPSHGPQPLDPLFFIAFDQRILPDAVLDTIQVTADGQDVAIQLANLDEFEEDKNVTRLIERSGADRWVAFRAKDLLPTDSEIVVAVGPGTPSAEGPLVTQEVQSFNFRTYAPLQIEDHGCTWSRDDCHPLTPFFIRFNNPLDMDAYEDLMITIDPPIAGASVNIFGNTINIQGATEGSTTYRVTVDKDISDIFGQTLGKSERLTFRVGRAEPYLTGPDKFLVTLDPGSSQPLFSVYSLNYTKLDVKVYGVQPEDWPAFKEYLNEYHRQDPAPDPPGRLVLDETMNLESPSDVLVQVDIDLGRVMDGDFDHFIVIVEPTRGILDLDQDRYWPIVQSWVQVTEIGLDAIVDHSEMIVWTTDLQDGTPLAGVEIVAMPSGRTFTTEENGAVRFNLPQLGTSFLVAHKGIDTVILPHSLYWGDSSWNIRSVNDELRWYVFDDRQMYRPGEKVHLKGWIRLIGGVQDGDVGLVGPGLEQISYLVTGSQGNTLDEGIAEVNNLGGFDLAFSVPENANLGYAQIQFNAHINRTQISGISYYHSLQIQEFRRPEFEVVARNESTGPYFVGGHATVAVEANYFAGGPLPNAEVSWLVTSSPSNYNPPNWPDFIFGTWTPWWYFGHVFVEMAYSPLYPDYTDVDVESFGGTTDASGNHYLRLDFDEADEPRPFSVLAEATVFDVNRQAWASETSLLVHPANLYVGLQSDRTFVERGTPLEINLIVTDLDGNPIADRPIEVTAGRLEWKYSSNTWKEEIVDVQTCSVGSKSEPVTCNFETNLGGRYQVTATVIDEMGRRNQSRFTRWVSGGQQPPAREVEQETVSLIPDKETYQPGDVAKILVQAPFSPAEGQLIVSRSGILYTERFVMEEDTITLDVPIDEAHIPNLHVQVDLVGASPRTDDEGEMIEDIAPRPAYAIGQLNLSIPPLERTLSLEVIPSETELEPGGETSLSLSLTDARGQPVSGAELAVVIVDEAVLALSNYQLADPISVFYRHRNSDISGYYGRASIVLANPQALLDAARAGGADMEVAEEAMAMAPMATNMPGELGRAFDDASGLGTETSPIRVRTDFNPLATFSPEVRTDTDGKAIVEVTLPDNLTRYRVMVVAVDSGNQFGTGEANITARLPLMVRPSAPRFLNFGDEFELPVVLQNQTDEELIVEVVVQAGNIELIGGAGLRVNVPARDRIEVRFPSTTDKPGTAKFQIAAISGSYADASVVELPVYTPATTEAFAVYGVVDEGAIVQPVNSPSEVFSQFGGLEITTSSTALQALTDAVLYLVSYPYECTEQLASRILAIAGLRDVLTAFSADGLPTVSEMEAAVARDIEKLNDLQNFDGGFPYWRRGYDSIPFHSIHVAHALQRAELKGFEVPGSMQDQLLDYLRNIESHYPHWYSLRTRQSLSAYALYVRDLMGESDVDKARKLFNEANLDDLPLEAVGWLWQVLLNDRSAGSELDAIRRHVNNRVVETAGAANFTTSYTDQAYLLLRSNRRIDAILLDAIIADDPGSDLIPKVVNGLLAHRTRGRWRNTQENVFVLLALDRYFNTFEAQTPDFVANIWLGDKYAGSHEFAGRTTERHQTDIPMVYLVDESLGGGETQDLILNKDGAGRLYYRLGLRYAPTDLNLDPLEMGFVVQRAYEAVDDPEDVIQDEDGRWHIKAGARVRVRLTMVADNRRYHVALVDPLPAGLEIVNPALAVSGSTPQDPNSSDFRYGWWWWWPWYEHQNMRDHRAEAFSSLLWDGVYNYSYIARATTPGTFVVPPAKAEEMYSPEVFGRSGSDWVIVE